MLATYQALLKGDRLEWTEAAPRLPVDNEGVPVHVTILAQLPEEVTRRGEHMAAVLAELAAEGGVRAIDDPQRWQREMREERPLVGREAA